MAVNRHFMLQKDRSQPHIGPFRHDVDAFAGLSKLCDSDFLGYMFGIDDSGVGRIIRRHEPFLASVMALQKGPKLSKEEVESLMIDATEQARKGPKRRQKPYYSGKKTTHS